MTAGDDPRERPDLIHADLNDAARQGAPATDAPAPDFPTALVSRLEILPKPDRSGTAITEEDIAAAAALDVAHFADLCGKLRVIGVTLAPFRERVKAHQRKAPPVPSLRRARVAEHQADEEHEGDPGPDVIDAPAPAVQAWEERILRTKEGDPVSHVSNAITILRNDINWRGVLAWDRFRQQIAFRREPTWYHDDAPASAVDVLDDEGEVRLTAWLFRRYKLSVTKEVAAQAAGIVAKGNEFDSLIAYLDGLVWDGVPRLLSWLTTYCGAADTPYARFVGRAWPVSAVARAYLPGVQVDHALILEGEQNEGKSSLIRALFGERFSESPLDLASKDRFVNLRGVWCQSFDELAGLLRSENETAKNFLTATFDIYRPPYGRHPVKVPRRCVFAGTVNPGGVGYLKDPTGNRRYWPIACAVVHPMDRAALERDMEQLWAEAVAAHKAGEKWWPETTEEKTLCREEQAKREEDTPWDETIGKWLAGIPLDCRACRGRGEKDCSACDGAGKVKPFKPSVDGNGRRFVTQADALSICLQMPDKDQGNRHTATVASALSRNGWKRPPGGLRPRRNGVRVSAYYHPDDLANEGERAALEGRAPFAPEKPEGE